MHLVPCYHYSLLSDKELSVQCCLAKPFAIHVKSAILDLAGHQNISNISLDLLRDDLKRNGWSYGFVNYIDQDGQLWLQVDAEKGGEVRFWRMGMDQPIQSPFNWDFALKDRRN
jgi:hypothetical protein